MKKRVEKLINKDTLSERIITLSERTWSSVLDWTTLPNHDKSDLTVWLDFKEIIGKWCNRTKLGRYKRFDQIDGYRSLLFCAIQVKSELKRVI